MHTCDAFVETARQAGAVVELSISMHSWLADCCKSQPCIDTMSGHSDGNKPEAAIRRHTGS